MHVFERFWSAGVRRAMGGLSAAAGGGLALVAVVGVQTFPATAAPVPEPGNRQSVALQSLVNETMSLQKSDLIRLEADLTPNRPLRAVVTIDGQLRELDLRPESMRADDYQVFIDVEGQLFEIEPAPVNTLRGTVIGDPGSLVAASTDEHGVHARIVLSDEREYWLEPVVARLEGVDPTLHVLYSSTDVVREQTSCGMTDNFLLETQGHLGLENGGPLGASSGGDLYRTEMAVDADFRYFNRYGETGAQNRINTIINTMNTEYERDVSIRHIITTMIIRTTNFPTEYQTSNMSSLLNNFRAVWIRDHTDIERDIAHLFVGLGSGGTIGIAWLGVICDSRFSGLGYGVVKDFGGLSCRTDLSAHELGHNWSAPHCDPCSTTMRSSLGCANRFGSSTIDIITNHRNSRGCLDVGPDAPLNDNCASAISIDDESIGFSTEAATDAGPDLPETCNEGGGLLFRKDIWYAYTASCDGIATAEVCDADFDTRLAVYEDGDCPGGFLACNDNACGEGGSRSSVDFPVTAGSTYLVRIGARFAVGAGTLTLSCAQVEPCPEDLDGSGAADFGDILAILSAWGPCENCPEDLDGSGAADFGDILAVLSAWGPCS